MPKTSTIQIDVSLDDEKVPESISWQASDTFADQKKAASAMMVSFWDNSEKNAFRIDLWTRRMMVDEMSDFFYQTMMGMADTYHKATRDEELSSDLRKAASDFIRKFRAKQKPAAG
jgi:gliding motility-associated protein GldC